MFTKEDWDKWKNRGKCLRRNDQYKAKSQKLFENATKYEGYLFVPEEDFKKIGILYRFYQKSCDFFQEKYGKPIGRRIFDKSLQQYRYMLTTEFIAKEIMRTQLPMIIELAKKLGNFNKELLSLEVEHDKYINYLLRRDRCVSYREIEDDESIYDQFV